ncbi:hypothetical protein BaRGS_00031291 [Batillaria attramentaria]|uniref:Uncharacterized protein n=1 Tax=Batillaria attramentaria TaxID=370345 RepID=A0ABD0JSC2_9CAEN
MADKVSRCRLSSQAKCDTEGVSPKSAVSTEVTLEVPKVSLFDQKIQVRVQGLPSSAEVTLHLTTEQEWRRSPALFVSCSHHIASRTGEVDLNTDPSLGGSYTGVDPMGLFWSMRPSPSGPQNTRMVVKDVEKPVVYILSVYAGHIELNDLHGSDAQNTHQPLASTLIHRFVKSPDVQRIPVKEGRVRGTLFLPPGEETHQGVIDMFGLAGGLMEARGALLASHGFATLCLPFFNYDDLPTNLDGITFDYFEDAAKWLSNHQAVRDGGIGIVATSGGAVFALLMAWKCPEVTALVRVNGPPFYYFGDLYWKGKLFRRMLPIDFDKMEDHGEGMDGRHAYACNQSGFIPVWESPVHILTLCSDDDGQVHPILGDQQRDMYPEDKRHLLQKRGSKSRVVQRTKQRELCGHQWVSGICGRHPSSKTEINLEKAPRSRIQMSGHQMSVQACQTAPSTSVALSRLGHLHCVLQRSFHTAPCHALSTSQSQAIQINPTVTLFDEKVSIKVKSLPSNAKVTLRMATEQEWRRSPALFFSCSHHIASQAGEVDLNTNPSLGGTYTGLDPMGLFWSLCPDPSGPQNIRMVLKNVEQPCLYTLSVYLGHIGLNDLHTSQVTHQPVSVTTITRLKKAADVRRIPIKEGNVRGTLFLPPGDGPHQGVIDMFGSAGGIMEMRAALLASHGFATLSLPYFHYQDLPRTLEEVQFDYFEEALRWIVSLKCIRSGGVGIVGASTGAVFGMIMAWKFPEVVAIVHINGPTFVWTHDIYYKGKLLKDCKPFQSHLVNFTSEGIGFTEAFPHKKEDVIPVWEGSSRVLYLISDDDQQCNPTFGDELYTMYPEDKRHLIEVVHYPGAGHLLEPPYTPHCRHCINPGYNFEMLWGGTPAPQAAAQDDAWQRIITFLHKHLP